VLVVDESEAVRKLVARALADAGHEVLAAASAEAALDVVAARGERLDLAVIDVHLARTDGQTLASVLRRDHPSLPVLFVSGYGDAEQRALVKGYLLAKPFDLDTLVHHVQALLTLGRPDSGPDACAS